MPFLQVNFIILIPFNKSKTAFFSIFRAFSVVFNKFHKIMENLFSPLQDIVLKSFLSFLKFF